MQTKKKKKKCDLFLDDGPGIRAFVLSLYGQWGYVLIFFFVVGGEKNVDIAHFYVPHLFFFFFGLQNGRSSYVTTYLFGNTSNSGSCNPGGSRTDCGYYGITEEECLSNGCCWSPVNPNPSNLPWCFYYNGEGPTGKVFAICLFVLFCLIPTDLEYVQSVATSSATCDCWEEYQAMTFFTSMLQRKGLYEGAKLAKMLGFNEIAQSYEQTIATLNSSITQQFYQPSSNLVIQSNERTWDSAVILGSIYGDTGDLFGPTNSAILNTAAQTRQWAADVCAFFFFFFWLSFVGIRSLNLFSI
ncbi:hypothetical protein RFI_04200 [Reticulomyxa filosa]|uniref:P-type domain-containing protein n=1 Tax=Reticulomyxa filosa TaxID=46433 RepID=X6P409_RETFI|nr:hypothetical protein RFI_04200 [Reticulomyxa filosa]|eukprot:ETO32916.1 hypothetical protein RFI_04200 [Reticulomyxa filosa]